MSKVNWLDALIIVISIALSFIGLRQGLIKLMFTLAGLIAGIYLAGHYYGTAAEQLFGSGSEANIGAFALILVTVLVVAALFGFLLQRLLRTLELGWVDRGGGVVLGLGIGAIACAAMLAIVAKYPLWGIENAISQSYLAEFLIERFPLMLDILPEEFDFLCQFFQ
jgi:membrane protein required for colicin V production